MAKRTDTATRMIPARPEALFAASIDPDAVAVWLPPKGMKARVERFEPRPGGAFDLVLTYASGPNAAAKSTEASDVVRGRFVALDPPHQLVQEVAFASDDPGYAGTMRMTWDFLPSGDGTEARITARNVPEGISAEDHATGLASTLESLAEYVASRA